MKKYALCLIRKYLFDIHHYPCMPPLMDLDLFHEKDIHEDAKRPRNRRINDSVIVFVVRPFFIAGLNQ